MFSLLLFLLILVSHSEQKVIVRQARTELEINEAVGVTEGDSRPLVEGDIVSWTSDRSKRSLMRDRDLTWPNGVVPFEMSPRLGWNGRKEIIRAMTHWQNLTCLRFKSRTYEKDYVLFVKESGCWSHVGRVGGMQKLSVGSECETMGIVAHEIGHAVAFWHEHSRPDRNKYIKILKKNVKSERLHAFDRMSKSKVNSLKVPYDFLSIMHYDENAFSKNTRPTIQLRHEWKGKTLKLGQRDGLSELDAMQAKMLYGCDGWKSDKQTRKRRKQLRSQTEVVKNVKTNKY
ncbi:blastula protease 10-like [Corticium candelabrum]|uniref:blastula protease 10-like n=1 Tax=Corticium candelabrum TaxID=121492 RepID=UPI002E262651|nr:blastula protease 10-like [Corticium candelabrum]